MSHSNKVSSAIMSAALMLALTANLISQTVTQPVSDVSPTMKVYKYPYIISPTQKKDIEYILVLASTGEVKSVFNACDVCYTAHKGYSQTGTELRCNNCGNRFQIDALGIKNTGGTCNPGYLPHTIQSDNVVINVSDLIAGAYFFLASPYTGVDDLRSPGTAQLFSSHDKLTVTLPGEARRAFHLYSLNGGLLRTTTGVSATMRIDISDLAPGPYYLAIEQAGKVKGMSFLKF
jgi:hypothetical protein